MTKPGLLLLVLPLVLVACSGVAPAPDGDATSTEDELRALRPAEVVGSIAYGETKSGIAYDGSNTYRALSFSGSAGDNITIDVRAASADARVWLLDSTYRTLKSNDDAAPGTKDSRVTFRLASSGTHYIAFREKSFASASFSISLARSSAVSSDDPFDPASCQGLLLDPVTPLFTPGAVSRDLGATHVEWQYRRCNAVTGCTAWQSELSSHGGVQWAGTAQLSIVPPDNAVHLDLWGATSPDPHHQVAYCRVANGLISCVPQQESAVVSLAPSGEMRRTCLRMTGYLQDRNALTAQLTGDEYRVAILARY
jgi:hypothetical protein